MKPQPRPSSATRSSMGVSPLRSYPLPTKSPSMTPSTRVRKHQRTPSTKKDKQMRQPSVTPKNPAKTPRRQRPSSESSFQSSSFSSGNDPLLNPQMQHQIVVKPQRKEPRRSSSVPSSVSRRKRPDDKYTSVRRAVEELNRAIGQERRIAAITNACAEFDHWDETKHSAELNCGAANVLSLVLSMTDNDDEIRMICAALEMVFRASSAMVKASFQEVGSAVVPLMLRLLERCESGSMKHADVSITNISKVLLYFSRVPELRVPLARHQGLLAALTRVATSILNADCRVVRMRVLANLANSEDNKVTMFEHGGLVESVLKIATLDLSDSAREFASAALMDLASSPYNQVPMARSDKLLGTLVKLAVIDDKAETREFAVTGLQNLAFAKENRKRLATYGSGVVIEALKKTVSSDPCDKARRRAAGALTNLTCDETAERIGNHKGLLNTLANVTSMDKNSDVQKRAVLALTKIATSITIDMPCHSALLDALVTAAASQNSHGVASVLRMKARVPENRDSMARHPYVLDTLCHICRGSDKDYPLKERDNALRAIMHLSNESANRRLMCNKMILDALVHCAGQTGDEHEETRESAIVTIERLATEVSNRQYLSRHEGLIVAVAHATERELKAELAMESGENPSAHPENPSGHSRLAKPLLMSLLLAM